MAADSDRESDAQGVAQNRRIPTSNGTGMSILKWLLIVVVGLAVLAVMLGQLGLLRGSAPKDLGVKDGKLKRPSKTPNSVTSQAPHWPDHPQQSYAHIDPLPMKGDGPATLLRLKSIVSAMPGAKLVTADGDYLYAQFTTPLMKYTDDTEFWWDRSAGVVQVRSASRLGQRDFAANRKRIEAIRAALLAS
jgi:uncharacterized protein (DUF1499 family)